MFAWQPVGVGFTETYRNHFVEKMGRWDDGSPGSGYQWIILVACIQDLAQDLQPPADGQEYPVVYWGMEHFFVLRKYEY